MGNILTVAVDTVPRSVSEYIDKFIKEGSNTASGGYLSPKDECAEESEINNRKSSVGITCRCSSSTSESRDKSFPIDCLVNIWCVDSDGQGEASALPYRFDPTFENRLERNSSYILLFVYGICYQCSLALHDDFQNVGICEDPILASLFAEVQSKIVFSATPIYVGHSNTLTYNHKDNTCGQISYSVNRLRLTYEIHIWHGNEASVINKTTASATAARLHSALSSNIELFDSSHRFCRTISGCRRLDSSSLVLVSHRPSVEPSRCASDKSPKAVSCAIIEFVLSSWFASGPRNQSLLTPELSSSVIDRGEDTTNQVLKRPQSVTTQTPSPNQAASVIKHEKGHVMTRHNISQRHFGVTPVIISPRTITAKSRIVAALAISPRGVTSRAINMNNETQIFKAKHGIKTQEHERSSLENATPSPSKRLRFSKHSSSNMEVGSLPSDELSYLELQLEVSAPKSASSSEDHLKVSHIPPHCVPTSHSENGRHRSLQFPPHHKRTLRRSFTSVSPKKHFDDGAPTKVSSASSLDVTQTNTVIDDDLASSSSSLSSSLTPSPPCPCSNNARPPKIVGRIGLVPELRLNALQESNDARHIARSSERFVSESNHQNSVDSYSSPRSPCTSGNRPLPVSSYFPVSNGDSDHDHHMLPSGTATSETASSVGTSTFDPSWSKATPTAGQSSTLPTNEHDTRMRASGVSRLRLGAVQPRQQQTIPSVSRKVPPLVSHGSISSRSSWGGSDVSDGPDDIRKEMSKLSSQNDDSCNWVEGGAVVEEACESHRSKQENTVNGAGVVHRDIPSDTVIEEYCSRWLAHLDEMNDSLDQDDEVFIPKEALLEKYRNVCSEVIPYARLYISGISVAQNYSVLREIGMTHLVNVAGDTCKNSFPDQFRYLTFVLQDTRHTNEDIQAVLYNALEYIHSVLLTPTNKILIHCREGVSRSATLVVAYLMWRGRVSFSEALNILRESRPMCNPNTGFTFILLRFQKALTYSRQWSLVDEDQMGSPPSSSSSDFEKGNQFDPFSRPLTSPPDLNSCPREFSLSRFSSTTRLSMSSKPKDPLHFDNRSDPHGVNDHQFNDPCFREPRNIERRLLRCCVHHEKAVFLIALGVSLYEPSQRTWMPPIDQGLDPRFFYILRNNNQIYFWKGSKSVHRQITESFLVDEYLRQLRLFEGPRLEQDWSIFYVKEGEEPDVFWEYLYPSVSKRQKAERRITQSKELGFAFSTLQCNEVYNFAEFCRRQHLGILNCFDAVEPLAPSSVVTSLSLSVNKNESNLVVNDQANRQCINLSPIILWSSSDRDRGALTNSDRDVEALCDFDGERCTRSKSTLRGHFTVASVQQLQQPQQALAVASIGNTSFQASQIHLRRHHDDSSYSSDAAIPHGMAVSLELLCDGSTTLDSQNPEQPPSFISSRHSSGTSLPAVHASSVYIADVTDDTPVHSKSSCNDTHAPRFDQVTSFSSQDVNEYATHLVTAKAGDSRSNTNTSINRVGFAFPLSTRDDELHFRKALPSDRVQNEPEDLREMLKLSRDDSQGSRRKRENSFPEFQGDATNGSQSDSLLPLDIRTLSHDQDLALSIRGSLLASPKPFHILNNQLTPACSPSRSSDIRSSLTSTERISATVLRTDIRSVKVREGSVDLEPNVPYLYTWPDFASPLDVFDDEDLLPAGFYIIAQYGPKPLLDMLGRLQLPFSRSPRSIKSVRSTKSLKSAKERRVSGCPTLTARSLRAVSKLGFSSDSDSPRSVRMAAMNTCIHRKPDTTIMTSDESTSEEDGSSSDNSTPTTTTTIYYDDARSTSQQSIVFKDVTTIPKDKATARVTSVGGSYRHGSTIIRGEPATASAPEVLPLAPLLTLLPVTEPARLSDGLTRAIEIPAVNGAASLSFRPIIYSPLETYESSRRTEDLSSMRTSSSCRQQQLPESSEVPNPSSHRVSPISKDTVIVTTGWVPPVDEVEIEAAVTPTILWVWRGSEWRANNVDDIRLSDEEILEQFKDSHGIPRDDKDVLVYWEEDGNESDLFQKVLWLS